MYVVKRLGKNGMWSAVSLIDQNGSFRGEAKFETREEAVEYRAEYLERMKTRLKVTPEGYGEVKVFDGDKPVETADTKKKKSRKAKSSPKSKVYENQKKKTRDYRLQF
jgi:DNA-binding protein H-NS